MTGKGWNAQGACLTWALISRQLTSLLCRPFARSARGSQETFGLGPSTADPASLPRSNVSPAPGPTSAPLKKTASAESAKSSKSRVSLVRLSAPPISSSRRGSPISRKGVNQSPASTSTKRVERVEPSSSAQPAPRPDKGKGRASMTETATEQRPVVLDSEDDDHEVATQLIVRRKRSSVAPAVSPNSPERASSQQEESHRAPSLRPKPEGLVIPATDEEVDELEDDDEPPPQAPTSLAHQSPPSAEPILDVPAPSLVTPPGVASPPNSRADDGSRPWVVTARSLAASSARSSPKRPLSPEASGSRSPSRVAFLPRTSGLASNGLPRRLQPSRAPPTASAASKSASTTPAPEAEPSTVALGPVPVAQPSAAGTEALPVRQFLPPVTEPSTKRRRGTPSPYPAPIDDWEKAFIELDKSITKELQKQLDRAPPAPRLFDASPYASFIPQVGGGAPLAASIMAPAPISVARAFLLRDPHKPGLPGPRSKPARPLPRKSDPVHDDTRAKDSVASDVQNSSAVEQHNVGLEEAASQYARSHKIPVADLHSAVLHHTSLPSGASGSGAAPQFSTMAHASLPAGALLQGQWLLPTPVASSVAVPLPVAPSLPSPFPPTASRKLTADQRSSLLTGWPTYTVLQAETMKRVLQEHGLWDDALSILRAAPLPRDAIDPTRLPSRPSRPDSQRDSVAATETGQNTHLSSTFASVPHPQSAVFSGQPPPQAGVQMPPSASERLAAALFALYAAAPAPAVVRAELNTEALSVLVRALVTGPLPASELVQQVLDMGLSDLEIRRHIMSIAEPMTAARSGNWQLTDEALRTWLGADAAAAIAREDVVPGRPGFFPVNLKAIRLLGATIASANRTVPSLFALLRDSGVEANLFGPHVNLLAQPVDPTRRGEWWKMSNRMAEKLAEQKRLRYPLHTPTQKTPGVPGPGHDRGHSHASLGGPTASSDVLYRQSVVRGTAASSSQTQKDATAPRSTRITKPVHPPSAIGPVAAVDPTGPPKLPVPTQPGDLSVRITDQEVRDVLKSRLPAVKFSHHWRPRFGKGGNTWERVMRCLERVGGKVGPKPDSVLYHEDDGPLPGLPALDRDPSSKTYFLHRAKWATDPCFYRRAARAVSVDIYLDRVEHRRTPRAAIRPLIQDRHNYCRSGSRECADRYGRRHQRRR